VRHAVLSAQWRELWAKVTLSPDTVATPALVMLGSLALASMIALRPRSGPVKLAS